MTTNLDLPLTSGTYEMVVDRTQLERCWFEMEVTEDDIAAYFNEFPDADRDEVTVQDVLLWIFYSEGIEPVRSRVRNSHDEVLEIRTPDDHPTIERTYFGGTQKVSFSQFVLSVVKDRDEALRIARTLIASPDTTLMLPSDDDDVTQVEKYAVLNVPALQRQIDQLVEGR